MMATGRDDTNYTFNRMISEVVAKERGKGCVLSCKSETSQTLFRPWLQAQVLLHP